MKNLTPLDVVMRVNGMGTAAATQILKGLSDDAVDSLVELYNAGSDVRSLITLDYNQPKPRKEKAPAFKSEKHSQ